MKEFNNILFIPETGNRFNRIITFYKALNNCDFIICHSLFFTTNKFLFFLVFFKRFLRKAIWIEWGADLYLWERDNVGFKNKILNKINKKIRENFKHIGFTFPTNDIVFKNTIKSRADKFFYTPMPNPNKEPTGLMDYIDSIKPKETSGHKLRVQVAHNSFFFNNHIKILDSLLPYKDEDMQLVIPMTYGVYGINGRFGGRNYIDSVKKYAKNRFGKKALFLVNNMKFEAYVKFLWSIDIAVFDFDRPCGLGNIRMLLYMGKKIFLPAGNPFYQFLTDNGIKVYDTDSISKMTFEEFAAPLESYDLTWIKEYLNNDKVMEHWEYMFNQLELELGK